MRTPHQIAARIPLAALLAAVVAGTPVRAGAEAAPDGVWAVAQVTLNGQPRAEGKLLNSTWTFKGDELIVRPAAGGHVRWSLSYELGAEPAAFRATPLDAPGERPLWMILSLRAAELRVAFYDGLDDRPEDFGPRPKLVVPSLVPAPAVTATPDPCEILRSAGVEQLLGGPTRRKPPPATIRPGVTCTLERDDGSGAVGLTLVAPPAATGYVDAARREAESRERVTLEAEPALGPEAFSAGRGETVATVAIKQDTAMVLRFEAPAVPRAEARRFAERVRDRL